MPVIDVAPDGSVASSGRRRFPLVDVVIGTPVTGPRYGAPALLPHGVVLNLYADKACTTVLDATDVAGTPISSVVINGVSIPEFYGPDNASTVEVFARVDGVTGSGFSLWAKGMDGLQGPSGPAGLGAPPSGYPVLATNLFTNPAAAVDTSGVTAGSCTLTRATDWRASGAFALTVPAGSSAGADTFSQLNMGPSQLIPGKTWTVSADVYTPAAQTGTLDTRARRISVFYRTGSGPYTTLNSQPGPAVGAGRVSVTFTPPTGSTECTVRLYNGSPTAGEVVEWDAILVTEGAAQPSYFDGSTPGARWTGTANASTSELVTPRAADEPTLPVIATNQIRNPVAGKDAASWSGTNATLTAVAVTDAPDGVRTALSVAAVAGGGVNAYPHGTGTSGVPVTAGVAGYLRFAAKNVSLGSTLSALIYWYSAAGATLSTTPTTVTNTPISSSSWSTFRLGAVTPPAGAAFATVTIGGNAAAAGETFLLTSVSWADADVLAFSGDTPGARWTGTSHASASELVRIQRVSELEAVVARAAPGAVRYVEGNGSPEGVVTAVVGTEYLDLAATTGAVRWIKATGTGATGWRVNYGETGRRDLTSTLKNGFALASAGGWFKVSRAGNRVTVYVREVTGVNATTVAFANALPAGFRPTTSYPTTACRWYGNGGAYLSVHPFTFEPELSTNPSGWPTSVVWAELTYLTDDAWPTSLPGVAG